MMEMKSKTLLLSRTVLLAAMSSLEVAHSAGATQNLIGDLGDPNVRKKLSNRSSSQFLSLQATPGSTEDEVCLKLVMTKQPSRDVELTLAIPGEIDGKRVVLANDAFAGLNSPKLRLHLVIGEEHKMPVKMPVDCSMMFNKSTSIWSINFKSVDTGQAMLMNNMFSGLKNLRKLDILRFDTTNVVNTNGMFKDCNNLKGVDISAFTQQQKETFNIYAMFNGYAPTSTNKGRANQNEVKVRNWVSKNKVEGRIKTHNSLVAQYKKELSELRCYGKNRIIPEGGIDGIDWEKDEKGYQSLSNKHTQAKQDKFFHDLAREEPEGIPSDEDDDKQGESKLEIDLNDDKQPTRESSLMNKEGELSLQEVLEELDEGDQKDEGLGNQENNDDNQEVNKTIRHDEEDEKLENNDKINQQEKQEISMREKENAELQSRTIEEHEIKNEDPQQPKIIKDDKNEVSNPTTKKTTDENNTTADDPKEKDTHSANRTEKIEVHAQPKNENNLRAQGVNDTHNRSLQIEHRPQGFYERWIRPIIRRVVAAASQTMSALSRIGATVRGWF